MNWGETNRLEENGLERAKSERNGRWKSEGRRLEFKIVKVESFGAVDKIQDLCINGVDSYMAVMGLNGQEAA